MRLTAPFGIDISAEENSHEDKLQEKSSMKTEVLRADTEETLHESDNNTDQHNTNNNLLSPRDAVHRMSLPVPHGHKRSFSKASARSSISMISFQPTLSSSIRIRLASTGLSEASYEALPSKKIKLPHLTQPHHATHSSPATWFASAATALGSNQGSLWAYTIPTPIIALSQRETVRGGVLVLLELLPEDAVPAFRTPYDAKMAEHEAWVTQQKRQQRQMEMLRMTPAERSKAFHKNAMDDHYEFIEAHRRKEVEEERKREEDLREALASQRVSVALVAEACGKWLASSDNEGKAMDGDAVVDIVSNVLWEMIRDVQFAAEMARMLDMWKEWAEGGGMTKAHFEAVKKDKLYFAYAACLLCLIRDSAGSAAGSVVSDLQDCLRMWRKVRLG
jgi:hypothetical protein